MCSPVSKCGPKKRILFHVFLCKIETPRGIEHGIVAVFFTSFPFIAFPWKLQKIVCTFCYAGRWVSGGGGRGGAL
jgi:hypothetical protein